MAKVVRMFPPDVAAQLALETPTTPSGIIFAWGGFSFDLMPITFEEFLEIIPLIEKVAIVQAAYNAMQNGAGEGALMAIAGDVFGALVKEAPEIVERLREHLAKSPGVVPVDHPEDREVFDKWFMAQDAIGMLRAFFPKMKEVLANRPLEEPMAPNGKTTLKSEKTKATASTQS